MLTYATVIRVVTQNPGDAKTIRRRLGVDATSDLSKMQDGDTLYVVFPRSQHRKAKGIAKALALFRTVDVFVFDMDASGQATVQELIDAYGDQAWEVIQDMSRPLQRIDLVSAMVRAMEVGELAAWKLEPGESRLLYAILAAAARPRAGKSQRKNLQRQKFGSMRLNVSKSELLRVSPMNSNLVPEYFKKLEAKGYVTVTSTLGYYQLLINLDSIKYTLFESFSNQLSNRVYEILSPYAAEYYMGGSTLNEKTYMPKFYKTNSLTSCSVDRNITKTSDSIAPGLLESKPGAITSLSSKIPEHTTWLRLPYYEEDHLNFFPGKPKTNVGIQREGDTSYIAPQKSTTPKIPMGINNFGLSKGEWSPRHAFVFRLINLGFSHRAAAALLGVSHSTVLTWVKNWLHVVKYGSSMGHFLWLTFMERKKRDWNRAPGWLVRIVERSMSWFRPIAWYKVSEWVRVMCRYDIRGIRTRPNAAKHWQFIPRGFLRAYA